MIRFSCLSSGKAVAAPDECAGRSTRCPGCKNPIVVPQPVPSRIQQAPEPASSQDQATLDRAISPKPLGMRMLLRCIGEAVCVKGPKALLSMVPFGEVLYDIAEETYKRFKRASEEEQRAAIAATAEATGEKVHREAEEVVREIPAAQSLPPEAQMTLVSYLSQVPSVVRQTLKRPSDPSGKTVPSSFTVKRPEQVLTMLPQRLPTLKQGHRVANWELVELVGAGGFGEVWLARHPSLHGLTAALKFCLDPTAASALRHEAALLDRVMQQGKHPGIVPLRQAYLDQEPLCLEYEYVSGGDLTALVGDWQRKGKTPRRQINGLIQRLAEIVAHAHKLSPPIVHRDLKPANILVERSRDHKIRLRITDFGIGGVAATQSLQGTWRCTTTRLQQLSTSLRGSHTLIYASPQQIKGEPPDPRDDVHALGVIWFQVLTGDLTTGIPADWMTVLRDMGQPEPLIRLLGACVASRSENRLASASVLCEKLAAELSSDEVLEVIPVPETDSPTSAQQSPLPSRPATLSPSRQVETVRVPPAVTQRGTPEEVLEVLPAEMERSVSTRDSRSLLRSGNQLRHYRAPGLRMADLTRHLLNWLRGEGFNTQDLKTDDGSTLIQIQQKGSWRKLVGMETALNIVLDHRGNDLTVEIGAGQWCDKVAAGVVSLFVLWPLAVTAAIGAWSQSQMPERVFSRVDDFLASRQPQSLSKDGQPTDVITRLRELAELRDQGILTEEEFQVQKARLLG
jgi:serine/threonine protein kinase